MDPIKNYRLMPGSFAQVCGKVVMITSISGNTDEPIGFTDFMGEDSDIKALNGISSKFYPIPLTSEWMDFCGVDPMIHAIPEEVKYVHTLQMYMIAILNDPLIENILSNFENTGSWPDLIEEDDD